MQASGTQGFQKWMLGTLELELQVVVSCLTRALRTKLWSSLGAVNILNH